MNVMTLDARAMKTLMNSISGELAGVENYKITRASAAYAHIALVRRCIELRANALSSIPYYLYQNDQRTEWIYRQPLDQLVWRVEADLCIFGRAFLLKQVNPLGIITGLQMLNPNSIEVLYDGSTNGEPRLRFKQTIDGKHHATFSSEQVVYFAEWSPDNDLGGDTAPARTALLPAQLQYYMAQYASAYFEEGTMPATIVTVPRHVTDSDRDVLRNWFSRQLRGIRRGVYKIIPLTTDVSIKTLTPDLASLALPELTRFSKEQVALAFGIPQTLLDDAANYATAESHRKSFWTETINPRARMIESVLNQQLFNGTNYRVKLAIEEVSVFQVDETQRSAAWLNYVKGGIAPEVAAEMLGLEIPDRQGQKSAPVPSSASVQSELEAWQRKAKNRLKQGKHANCSFESTVIPDSIKAIIHHGLQDAKTREEIDHVFGAEDAPRENPTKSERN